MSEPMQLSTDGREVTIVQSMVPRRLTGNQRAILRHARAYGMVTVIDAAVIMRGIVNRDNVALARRSGYGAIRRLVDRGLLERYYPPIGNPRQGAWRATR